MDEDLGERPRGKIHRVKSDKNSLLDENRLTRHKTPPQSVLRLRGRLNGWCAVDCAAGGPVPGAYAHPGQIVRCRLYVLHTDRSILTPRIQYGVGYSPKACLTKLGSTLTITPAGRISLKNPVLSIRCRIPSFKGASNEPLRISPCIFISQGLKDFPIEADYSLGLPLSQEAVQPKLWILRTWWFHIRTEQCPQMIWIQCREEPIAGKAKGKRAVIGNVKTVFSEQIVGPQYVLIS